MQVFRTPDAVISSPSACAIGMFDGIHLGHRMVLEQALRDARIEGLRSVVFTFANHPQSIVSQTPTPLLSTLDDRLAAFEALNFDAALVLDFTPALRDIPADRFVRRYLLDTLQVKAVSVGYDHRFGQGRKGDGAYLQAEGEQHGFRVTIVEPVRVDDQILSSTLIRKLLSYGELEQANRFLGKPYSLMGPVTAGVGRGRTIGFPTANIDIENGRLLPASGVYAGFADILDPNGAVIAVDQAAVCNLGLAPTFGDQEKQRLEVHLLDQSHNLYGHLLRFHFVRHLRAEQAFPSVDALIRQLHTDCHQARQVLAETQPR